MNNARNTIILDLQTINHLADVILEHTLEKPTEKLLGDIKTLTNRILKVSEEYLNEQ
jgi:hypothetical protein